MKIIHKTLAGYIIAPKDKHNGNIYKENNIAAKIVPCGTPLCGPAANQYLQILAEKLLLDKQDDAWYGNVKIINTK